MELPPFEAKEGVSTSVCSQVSDFLINDQLANAVNLPLADMSLLKTLAPYLRLGNVMGKFLSQLSDSPIQSLEIESFGAINEVKPIMLSLLKGLFDNVTDVRVNYVNVLSIAEDRGISVKFSYNNSSVSYSNLVKAIMKTENFEYSIEACVLDNKIIKITKIMGYQIDVTPVGQMLLIQNNDIPGSSR